MLLSDCFADGSSPRCFNLLALGGRGIRCSILLICYWKGDSKNICTCYMLQGGAVHRQAWSRTSSCSLKMRTQNADADQRGLWNGAWSWQASASSLDKNGTWHSGSRYQEFVPVRSKLHTVGLQQRWGDCHVLRSRPSRKFSKQCPSVQVQS